MKAEEIPVLPLKGTALILGPYSDPGLRPMADLDVLVPSRFAARAAELLECEGFRRRGCGRDFRIVHSVPFERADGESIDLHAHVFEGGTADSDDDELWAASLPLEMSGRSMRVLAAHHQLLHTIAHGLRWSPSPPCRFLADAFVVLRRARDAFDWSGFVGAAQSRRLALAAATGLALLSEALDVLVPGDVGVRLGAEGVDPLDRRSFEARLRAPHLRGVLDSVALHRSRHRELVHSGVMPRSTVGLLRTAALTWGLDSAWDLPRAALGRLAQRGNANS